MEFSKRLDLFGDEIFAALNERKVALEAQGRTIYNLSVGTPDFAPAEHIRESCQTVQNYHPYFFQNMLVHENTYRFSVHSQIASNRKCHQNHK